MKFSYSHKILVALIFSLCSLTSYANSAQQIAEQKITELKELIKLAEKQGIDAEKEKMSIRTAEVYLGYANWDDNNLDANIAYFKQVAIYKKTAVKMANE